MTTLVLVERVHIPNMSTIGYGYGKLEDGTDVEFVGDHRPMRALGQALSDAEEPVAADVEDYQFVGGRSNG